ncbi:A24 family peptidase [Erythrobacter litoralis]|uniref:Type IV prepilin peptidase, cpaA n=1 Tax=Erythrobacter litoralis (strain HTCC2594) TaxID=314225 RepID=Q2ND43_ERYLH|nr:prepilin peptidase [Erythrobacter litoralis]ABC62398.1 type IV prepilin peptidase, cpaA [Erythrobacter litoralis HTCC2594]
MVADYLHYGLLVALAIALLTAAFTDLRSRQIGNWLNGAIALGAPLFWWSSGLDLWPGVAWQLGVALITFAICAGLFAMRWMGGGDVKLLTALALWIAPALFFNLIVIMALLGGVLTLLFGMWHLIRRQRERLAIPYGVAISAAGLWILTTHYFPLAQASIAAGSAVG